MQLPFLIRSILSFSPQCSTVGRHNGPSRIRTKLRCPYENSNRRAYGKTTKHNRDGSPQPQKWRQPFSWFSRWRRNSQEVRTPFARPAEQYGRRRSCAVDAAAVFKTSAGVADRVERTIADYSERHASLPDGKSGRTRSVPNERLAHYLFSCHRTSLAVVWSAPSMTMLVIFLCQ